MDDNRALWVTDIRVPGHYPSVRTTYDGKVRIMIVHPEYGREPTWVVLSRGAATKWAVKVLWCAVTLRWRERVVDPTPPEPDL